MNGMSWAISGRSIPGARSCAHRGSRRFPPAKVSGRVAKVRLRGDIVVVVVFDRAAGRLPVVLRGVVLRAVERLRVVNQRRRLQLAGVVAGR